MFADRLASFGCAWGFLDLFVTDYGDGATTRTNCLYRNNGDGSFGRIRTGSLANDSQLSSGACAWGDYDNDGFLDLVVTRYPEANLLYRNNGNGNSWVKIKLVGTLSNRSGIGAKVRVQARIGGRTFWQMRERKFCSLIPRRWARKRPAPPLASRLWTGNSVSSSIC